MNYNSDKAIESSEQDLLGRVTFAKQLGEAIYKYDGKDGLVLGVFGKWGTGKTSILNMVVNEINYLSDNDDDGSIIVNFSPWNYSDKDNLIGIFFEDLRIKLKLHSSKGYRSVFWCLKFIIIYIDCIKSELDYNVKVPFKMFI